MRLLAFGVVLFLLVAPTSALSAQLLAAREAEVTIDHPPLIPIRAETVLFLEPLDQCEEELSRSLAAFFLDAGVQVVDGVRLNALLAEHATSSASPGDPATLMAVGRALGPSAVIEVRSTVCETRHDRSEQTRLVRLPLQSTTRTVSESAGTEGNQEEEGTETTETTETTESVTTTEEVTTVQVRVVDRVARTGARTALTVRVFDLANDEVFGERPFSSSASLERHLTLEYPWSEEWPEAPPPEEAVVAAVDKVVDDVGRLFFPWSEDRTVWFYNSDKCGLKSAHRALRARSIDRALELSVQNLEACQRERKVKKRVLGNAYQNLGMTQAFVGNYDEALVNLREAAALRPGRIVTEAIAEVERSLDERETRRRFQGRTVSVREGWSGPLAERLEVVDAAAAEAASALTNADIVKMAQAGLTDAVIIARIENGVTGFSLGTEDLVALGEAGVSESVVVAMLAAEGPSQRQD